MSRGLAKESLTRAHEAAQRAVRLATGLAALRAWMASPGYDEADAPALLAVLVALSAAGQRRSSALTSAYVAAVLGLRPRGIDPGAVTGESVRAGTDPRDVYRRCFVQMWAALGNGTPWLEARNGAGSRAQSSAEMDVALAQRATYHEAQTVYPGIRGYKRVPDANACEFCRAIAGAFVKSADAMPLHNRCGCTLEPITDVPSDATFLPRGNVTHDSFAVREHGELGPMLTDPADHFTKEPA